MNDTGLPIEAAIPELRAGLAGAGRAVLTAEPGAGKTTVAPLRLLDQDWLRGRRIVMLEPRRLAARASAARMADLLGESVGDTVGVVTRDDRRVGPRTRIEVVTEGVLTRRIQTDPTLDGVGLVIFDEFHERSQQADLGLARRLDSVRGFGLDTAILIMSATIDAEQVASLIGEDEPAPIIACAGRTFPVEIDWRPRNRRDRLEPAVATAVNKAVEAEADGDVLVFLPGMAEIRRVQERLRSLDPRFVVHALHGSLPLDEQDRAVAPAPSGLRKVVLSTDIAESSLTVEGVTIVVDSGLARAPRFDPSNGMTRLSTVSISRASADQRAGRAGRLSPGRCVRLWSKIEHGTRLPFTPPEIAQVDLAGLRLELAAWGVTEPDPLAMLDPLPVPAWTEAGEVLMMLDAIGPTGSITERGKQLVRLPLHPRLGSIVTAGRDRGLGALGCVLAALIDERDVMSGRPGEVPVDLAERVALIRDPARRHPAASGRSIGLARRRAEDLMRRAGASDGGYDTDLIGLLVAAGFPDRVAQRRGNGRGRFRLRNGSGVRLPDNDTLAGEDFIVAVDLDGRRKDARVRLGAAVDPADLLATEGFGIEVTERLVWDRDRQDLTVRVRRHLGALEFGTSHRRPAPSPEVVDLLVDHVRRSRLDALTWTDNARTLRDRIIWVGGHRPDDGWPAVDDKALLASLDDWLAPLLVGATGRADVEMISVAVALDVMLGHGRRRELDRLVPTHVELPTRRAPIDWSGEEPLVRSRAQDFYGLSVHPHVLDGQVPVVVELLSPAQRPIQRTADLPGLWAGSWAEVRKDMAGRYPKHDWPTDPGASRR